MERDRQTDRQRERLIDRQTKKDVGTGERGRQRQTEIEKDKQT